MDDSLRILQLSFSSPNVMPMKVFGVSFASFHLPARHGGAPLKRCDAVATRWRRLQRPSQGRRRSLSHTLSRHFASNRVPAKIADRLSWPNSNLSTSSAVHYCYLCFNRGCSRSRLASCFLKTAFWNRAGRASVNGSEKTNNELADGDFAIVLIVFQYVALIQYWPPKFKTSVPDATSLRRGGEE
ncbi:unnamed protein product [Cylicocyclus nassatus]|uniref:Uncharacterized protein n=1 Tax=Cylicocyclus nassatus TaxID=53992 RepID=A0AA36LZ85_CYLNA|nr:unnamed protein product [Cylicocyclus nassatus]